MLLLVNHYMVEGMLLFHFLYGGLQPQVQIRF
jgi:hypothetical protein